MTLHVTPEGTPWSFVDLPQEKFPVRLAMFGPPVEDGDLTLHGDITVEPYVATHVPPMPPVTHIVCLYGDGEMRLYHDPTAHGRLDPATGEPPKR